MSGDGKCVKVFKGVSKGNKEGIRRQKSVERRNRVGEQERVNCSH